MLNSKMESAVTNWPFPASLKAAQYFLGFTNYHGHFFTDYPSVVTSITALTHKAVDPKHWSPEALEVFKTLKQAFLTGPALHWLHTTKIFYLEIYASTVGGRGASTGYQGKKHPCAFYFKMFTPARRNYRIRDNQLLAINLAPEEWRHLLEGSAHLFLITIT